MILFTQWIAMNQLTIHSPSKDHMLIRMFTACISTILHYVINALLDSCAKRSSSWWTGFFFKTIILFAYRIFWNPALTALLLGIPILKHTLKWDLRAKLNAHYLETQICWLLINICFCLFLTVCWIHQCREKTENSCGTFLLKPHIQTVVNQLSCGCSSRTFFSVSGLFKALFFSDHNCLSFSFDTYRWPLYCNYVCL